MQTTHFNNYNTSITPFSCFIDKTTDLLPTCIIHNMPHHYTTLYLSILSSKQIQYIVPSSLFLLLGGDIERNPGPVNYLLQNHPNDHKLRNQTYFTPNTIQLKLEYQHLTLSFDPHFIITHPNHLVSQHTHPFLHQFITQHNQYAPSILLYALIVIISPLPTRCNLLLFQPSPLLNTLIQCLSFLTQNPNHTLTTSHLYTQFFNNNQDLVSLPNNVHNTLYAHIFQSNLPATFESIKTLFPYLPDTLIYTALQCTHPLLGYSHPPPIINPPIARINNSEYSTSNTHFTTWNISSLNTSLPCLHSFLENNTPAIITLQETKLTAKKISKISPTNVLTI